MKTLNPNDFGKKLLTENCQRIRINDFLTGYQSQIKFSLLQSKLESAGMKINLVTSNTNYKGVRFWFECPKCYSRIGVLYMHPLTKEIGCRKCLNLDYRKHRYKGMLEAS